MMPIARREAIIWRLRFAPEDLLRLAQRGSTNFRRAPRHSRSRKDRRWVRRLCKVTMPWKACVQISVWRLHFGFRRVIPRLSIQKSPLPLRECRVLSSKPVGCQTG